jgi:hypothetical protein
MFGCMRSPVYSSILLLDMRCVYKCLIFNLELGNRKWDLKRTGILVTSGGTTEEDKMTYSWWFSCHYHYSVCNLTGAVKLLKWPDFPLSPVSHGSRGLNFECSFCTGSSDLWDQIREDLHLEDGYEEAVVLYQSPVMNRDSIYADNHRSCGDWI